MLCGWIDGFLRAKIFAFTFRVIVAFDMAVALGITGLRLRASRVHCIHLLSEVSGILILAWVGLHTCCCAIVGYAW